uniref:ribose-5-phosphate isomerase n=1 Tax=Trichobilharzia regenti TaxID=157069 RepID=A0AA85IKY8_TRIRE|nr:unnamed protein product [Trichobilharzia regenti]
MYCYLIIGNRYAGYRLLINQSSLLKSHYSTSSMDESAALELAKKNACQSAVRDWLKDNQIVGLGSGTTIKYAVEYIAEQVKKQHLHIQCIPTSFQARQLLISHKLPVTDLEMCEQIDVTFDGADEVDEKLNLIKGGGGCLLQEKIVASCTTNFIAIVDERLVDTCLAAIRLLSITLIIIIAIILYNEKYYPFNSLLSASMA